VDAVPRREPQGEAITRQCVAFREPVWALAMYREPSKDDEGEFAWLAEREATLSGILQELERGAARGRDVLERYEELNARLGWCVEQRGVMCEALVETRPREGDGGRIEELGRRAVELRHAIYGLDEELAEAELTLAQLRDEKCASRTWRATGEKEEDDTD